MATVKKNVLSLLVFVSLLLFSCNEEDPVSKVDVYIAGIEDQTQAVYWKNNEMTNLANGATRSFTTCAAAFGKDFYIGGNVDGATVYWKNGTLVQLAPSSKQARTYAIAASGSDVYVGGYEISNGILQATLWKNGIGSKFPLQQGSSFSTIVDIAVSGTDVHAIGAESNANNVFAKYWKNGNEVTFIQPTTQYPYAYLVDIEIFGNDVHIIGYIANSNGSRIYKYWKNGTEVPITGISPRMINVVNSDVYLLDESVKFYTKNGNEIRLPPSENQSLYSAVGFAVKNGDVYVAALKYSSLYSTGGYVWKNSVEMTPSLGDKARIDFRGFGVVDK